MLSNKRIKISEFEDKLIIKTASKKNWRFNISLLLFQIFFFIVVVTVSFVAIVLFSTNITAAIIISGFALTFITIFVWFWKILIWFLWGKEVVTIDRNSLKIQMKRAIGHPDKVYILKEIKDLRISQEPSCDILYLSFFDTTLAINTGGRIKFDYGMKTIRFFYLAENEEAQELLDFVKIKINTLLN